jgi:hypothetical protein
VKQLEGGVRRRSILVQRTEQSVDLPNGDLQSGFVVAGKRIRHLLSDFDLGDEIKAGDRGIAG